jgi:ribonuclease BN (tRNA processing enzyme)
MNYQSKLILLGTGTPIPDPDRSGPALAIIAGGDPYIVDFGTGIVRRAVQAGLDVTELTRAFLTHLHSDHTIGYPDLILTPWVLGRNVPLEVFGPPGIKDMTDHILRAYKDDIRERLEGLQPSNDNGWKVNAHEIEEDGVIYKDENIQVEAFSVSHGFLKTFGYKFVAPDRSIVISSDTAPSDIIIEKARDCDILVHEVYSVKGFRTRPVDWQKYHSSVHTSSHELAEIASKARPKLLVLYHQLTWGVSDEELLNEVREGYDGDVVSGRDLDVY